ncbi:MAG: DUF935 domain-containing protein [Deltaproteobacteria bacterium]|nr:DUF935 domain-containing protein [Deltaproteobacteria bacterium]
MIYDNFGKEIAVQKKPDDRVLAVASVRDRFSGYPSHGLTPQKLANIFKAADGGDVYSQMELFEEMEEKDTHLFSILQTRKSAALGLDFEIEPYSDDKKDIEIKEFVEENINNLPAFEENLFDLLDAIGKGYSALEIMWDIKDGANIIKNLGWIHPRKFTWNNSMFPKLLTEKEINGIDLPPFKFIFHRHRTKSGHPTRQGILRVASWFYLFKNYAVKDWLAFAEVFGMPLRLGKYDTGATKEDKDALINAVRSLGSDAAGIISKSTEIEFIEAAKNSGRDVYDLLVSLCNAEMSKAVLGQTLTTQQGESGSYSLGQVHNDVRRDLLEADCEMLAKTIRQDLIRPLVGFNFGWDAPLPWFKFHYEQQADLQAEAGKIKTLTEAGVKTIPVRWVHEKFNIPMPENGEETINPPSIPPLTKGDIGGFNGQANKYDSYLTSHISRSLCPVCMVNKAGAAFTPEQQAIEGLADKSLKEAEDAFLKNEEAILEAVEGADSFEDAMTRILELYPDMNMDSLSGILERGTLMAGLFGKYAAQGNV